MQKKLLALAHRAKTVADVASAMSKDDTADHGQLHQAMMDYRAAAVAYLAHPSVSDYVRSDAQRYDGKTREAVERIADLIDRLNEA